MILASEPGAAWFIRVRGDGLGGPLNGAGEEGNFELGLALLSAVPDHVVDESGDQRLDALGHPLALLDELVEEGQRLDLVLNGNDMSLFRFEVDLEARFRSLQLFALLIQRLHLGSERSQDSLSTFGHGLCQMGDFGTQIAELLLDALQIRPQLAGRLRGQFDSPRRHSAEDFRLEADLLEELQRRVVEGLRRHEAQLAIEPLGLLGVPAGVVRIGVPAAAGAGLGRHLVAARTAPQEPLKKVDVLLALPLLAPLVVQVPVHDLLDLLVRFPGPDRLPLSIVERSLVLLLRRIGRFVSFALFPRRLPSPSPSTYRSEMFQSTPADRLYSTNLLSRSSWVSSEPSCFLACLSVETRM